LVVDGLTNQQIADQLFISPRTVDTHRTNIMQKLDIHDLANLVRYAIEHGLAGSGAGTQPKKP
jgi:two-component system response regulator NreC